MKLTMFSTLLSNRVVLLSNLVHSFGMEQAEVGQSPTFPLGLQANVIADIPWVYPDGLKDYRDRF